MLLPTVFLLAAACVLATDNKPSETNTRALFALADVYQDGRLTLEEYQEILWKSKLEPNESDHADFLKIDTSGDGAVTLEELEEAIADGHILPPGALAAPLTLFQEADTNGDHLVCLAELYTLQSRLGIPWPKSSDQRFHAVDRKQPRGHLTEEEFINYWANMSEENSPSTVIPEEKAVFNKLDVNHDWLVSRQEALDGRQYLSKRTLSDYAIKAAFRVFDIDGNGLLLFNTEFVALYEDLKRGN